MSIVDDATSVLLLMASHGDEEQGPRQLDGEEISERSGLTSSRVNDAVTWLERNGYVLVSRYLGTAPYAFGRAELTSFGRYALQRLTTATDPVPGPDQTLGRLPVPVGSPFGFTELDWAYVQRERARTRTLRVVLGYQFHSEAYDTDRLISHVRDRFGQAVADYNARKGHQDIMLDFAPLRAGYGEHLFNRIARDIIAADIAVFEISDLNSNVMIELGVALTWGIVVLPIREADRQVSPADISGQTWVSYRDSGLIFLDSDFQASLVAMIERAMQRKSVL